MDNNTSTTTITQLQQSNRTALPAERDDVVPGFTSIKGFELLQRMAHIFTMSTMVPTEFQGNNNLGNAAIALEMAFRLKANPLMVFQNLYIVKGKPSWSAQFLIAIFNSCGKFTPLRFNFTGQPGKDDWGCRATSTVIATGEKLEGPLITIDLAKKNGWFAQGSSKWHSMPEMMLRYRSASWFVRLYAPDIVMGLHTVEENEEIELVQDVNGTFVQSQENAVTVTQEAVTEHVQTKPKKGGRPRKATAAAAPAAAPVQEPQEAPVQQVQTAEPMPAPVPEHAAQPVPEHAPQIQEAPIQQDIPVQQEVPPQSAEEAFQADYERLKKEVFLPACIKERVSLDQMIGACIHFYGGTKEQAVCNMSLNKGLFDEMVRAVKAKPGHYFNDDDMF